MTAQVFRHISGPGSGKTHTLLTFVSQEQEQEQGLALRDLTFCSFTRSQRDDIRVRIGALFPDATAKEIRKQVKTVHGVALTDCLRHGLIPELSRKDSPIITEGANPQPFERFCREYGLDYTRRTFLTSPDISGPGGRLSRRTATMSMTIMWRSLSTGRSSRLDSSVKIASITGCVIVATPLLHA